MKKIEKEIKKPTITQPLPKSKDSKKSKDLKPIPPRPPRFYLDPNGFVIFDYDDALEDHLSRFPQP